MSPSLVGLVAIGAMLSCGVYLVLDRSLTRMLLGVLLISNAVNLLLLITQPLLVGERQDHRLPRALLELHEDEVLPALFRSVVDPTSDECLVVGLDNALLVLASVLSCEGASDKPCQVPYSWP